MKKNIKYAILLALISTFFITSCDKNNDDPIDTTRKTDAEFQTLVTYLTDNNMDISNILDGWITTADAVYAIQTDSITDNDYFIIDIRSATDYGNGHIETAVNSTLGNVLTTAADANGKIILVTCYTGQTAGHAVCALRLSGFADAKVLKWGMSGWNSTLSASWENNTGDAGVNHANWTGAPGAVATDTEYDDPDLSPTATTGEEILAERVTVLLGGFNGITNGDVLTSPGNYFVNNFWAEADVEHYGHIAGAHRINPLTLAGNEYYNLDPSKTIVTYCWTGQTSSMVTAYLKVLGYNALSLKFGTNGMIYSVLESHKFVAPTTDLPLVQ